MSPAVCQGIIIKKQKNINTVKKYNKCLKNLEFVRDVVVPESALQVSERQRGRNKTFKGVVRPKLKIHPHFLLTALTGEALVTHFHDIILELLLVSRFIYAQQELAILSRANMNAAPL